MNVKNKHTKKHKYTKPLDVNECWSYMLELDECINDPDCFIWFDKNTYCFFHTRDLAPDGFESVPKSYWNNYIMLYKVNKDMQYKKMVEAIDLPEITEYFENAVDLDDLVDKYRKFVEVNCIYKDEANRMYYEFYSLFISWCEANNIEYIFEPENRSHLYQRRENVLSHNWQLPPEWMFPKE